MVFDFIAELAGTVADRMRKRAQGPAAGPANQTLMVGLYLAVAVVVIVAIGGWLLLTSIGPR